MRNSKAKQIRKAIRNFAELNKDTSYIETNKRQKLVSSGKLNPDGTDKKVVLHTHTIVLNPSCERAMYQEMKKLS